MTSPSRGIRLRSSARSDRGRVRQNNEDSVHLWGEELNVLAVVADGMGGAVAGEEASRIAIETIQEKLTSGAHRKAEDYEHYESDELGELMGDAVREANLNIIAKAHTKPELRGMGTTITMVFARQNDVVLAHVGDSRAYYIDSLDGGIRQLTEDHTFVQALLKAGHISAEEAEHHPMGNVLYRALGQAEDLDVEVKISIKLHMGDRLLLCSDGLTLHVEADEIADICLEYDDPTEISDQLINLALKRGGKDNVSVIVICVDEVSEDTKVDAETESAILQFDSVQTDDAPTVPMNPDFFNVTRKKSSNNTDDHLHNTSQKVDAYNTIYGEGRDAFEPLQ